MKIILSLGAILLMPLIIYSQYALKNSNVNDKEIIYIQVFSEKSTDSEINEPVEFATVKINTAIPNPLTASTHKNGIVPVRLKYFDLDHLNELEVSKENHYFTKKDYKTINRNMGGDTIFVFLKPKKSSYILNLQVIEEVDDFLPVKDAVVHIYGTNYSNIVRTDTFGLIKDTIPFDERSLTVSVENNIGYDDYKDCYFHGDDLSENDMSVRLVKNKFPFKLVVKERGPKGKRLKGVKINFLSHTLGTMKTDSNGVLKLTNLAPEYYIFQINGGKEYEPIEVDQYFQVTRSSDDKPNEKVVELDRRKLEKVKISGRIHLKDEYGNLLTPEKFYLQLEGKETVNLKVTPDGFYKTSIPFETILKSQSKFKIVVEHKKFERYSGSEIISFTEGSKFPREKNIDLITPKLRLKNMEFDIRTRYPNPERITFSFEKDGDKYSFIFNKKDDTLKYITATVTGLVGFEKMSIKTEKNGKAHSNTYTYAEYKRYLEDGKSLRIYTKCR